jgi:hypothetical protein
LETPGRKAVLGELDLAGDAGKKGALLSEMDVAGEVLLGQRSARCAAWVSRRGAWASRMLGGEEVEMLGRGEAGREVRGLGGDAGREVRGE